MFMFSYNTVFFIFFTLFKYKLWDSKGVFTFAMFGTLLWISVQMDKCEVHQ